VSDPTEQAETPIKAAIKLLRGQGFLVVRVPKCTQSPNHGRHILITKSVSCDSAFEDADSPWGEHKKEHHIA
jgi:hypothetical protein